MENETPFSFSTKPAKNRGAKQQLAAVERRASFQAKYGEELGPEPVVRKMQRCVHLSLVKVLADEFH